MAKGKPAKKERHARGAAPKISLVLTGIGTFAAVILAVVLLFAGDTIGNGIQNALGSNGTLLTILLAILGTNLDELIDIAGIVFLFCGIWCLIFWIICVASRTHRIRDVVCTVIGRIPMLLLGIVLVQIYRSFPFRALGWMTAGAFIWVILTILLSVPGWRKKA